MSNLTGMEELIQKISDRDIADYLFESYKCYCTGAYRACIVIANIALFEGLRRKINALAPVSGVCKDIAKDINPLSSSQKVFETPLIHKLREKEIITKFEAERLEQLNNHRNKSAHPSGHMPSAEEARFVFSDSINLFLSQPIRQTSYLVEEIISNIEGDNFYPSSIIQDIIEVTKQEVENLDDLAWPFLIIIMNEKLDSTDKVTKKNAQSFLYGVASMRQEASSNAITEKVIKPRLSSNSNQSTISALIGCNPCIIKSFEGGELLKLDSLLFNNAQKEGFDNNSTFLKSPSLIVTQLLHHLGENDLMKLKKFYKHVLAKCPLSGSFIDALKDQSSLKEIMKDKYVEVAGSSDYDTANRFAQRLQGLDANFAETFDGKFAFQLIAAVVYASEVGAYKAINVVNKNFAECDNLKSSALDFSKKNVKTANKILKSSYINLKLSEFKKSYLK